jgi:hypothetical protein
MPLHHPRMVRPTTLVSLLLAVLYSCPGAGCFAMPVSPEPLRVYHDANVKNCGSLYLDGNLLVAVLILIWVGFSLQRDLKSKKTSAGFRGRHVLDTRLYMVDRYREPLWYWLLIASRFFAGVYLLWYILR